MQTQTKQTLKIFWQHARKYPFSLFLVITGIIGTLLTDTYKPFLYKHFFDLLVSATPNVTPLLIGVLWQVLLMNALNWASWRAASFANNYFQTNVMADLYNTCFQYLHKHSYGFFSNNFVGSLVRKVGRYSRAFEGIADQFTFNLGRAALRIVLIAVVLYWRSPLVSGILVGWSLLYIFFQILAARYKLKYDIAKAALDTKTTGFLADTVSNNVNLKMFASLGREFSVFKKITGEWQKMVKFTWDLDQYIEAVQVGLMVILEFIIFYVALQNWKAGNFTVGDFALLQAYLGQIFSVLWDLGRHIRNIYENLADANEMTEVLLAPLEVDDIPDAHTLKVTNGKVEFKDVDFRYYDNKKVFHKFNFIIEPGERVALIGPSGGGKTTIVKMLLRFMDIQSGELLIDGQNIAHVTQDSLRKNIALVPQEPILFHRSLFDNIQYGKPGATKDEVIRASKLAHCHEFITGFPEQYGTFVGERGVKLSGGERQRVAIARAILKNAPILILDEATSSLDSESEHFIQDALRNLMKGKTTMVIAHRLSTIMQMDRIVVLEGGKITEQGKHEELLKAKQGTYQRLWEIQAGGFTQ